MRTRLRFTSFQSFVSIAPRSSSAIRWPSRSRSSAARRLPTAPRAIFRKKLESGLSASRSMQMLCFRSRVDGRLTVARRVHILVSAVAMAFLRTKTSRRATRPGRWNNTCQGRNRQGFHSRNSRAHSCPRRPHRRGVTSDPSSAAPSGADGACGDGGRRRPASEPRRHRHPQDAAGHHPDRFLEGALGCRWVFVSTASRPQQRSGGRACPLLFNYRRLSSSPRRRVATAGLGASRAHTSATALPRHSGTSDAWILTSRIKLIARRLLCCETLPSHWRTEGVAAGRAVLGRRT